MENILNGKYGTHDRHKFDMFFAESDNPTPLVIYIHGGGFIDGDKSFYPKEDKEKCLQNGISYATINYPFIIHKALHEILVDISSAITYFKDHSIKLNIDPQLIGCYGCSAGAGASLFLAGINDILKDKTNTCGISNNANIIAAGLYDTQSTYDFYKWTKLLNISIEELIRFSNEFENYPKYPLDLVYKSKIRNKSDFFTPKVLKYRSFLDLSGHITSLTPPIYIKSNVSANNSSDLLHAQIYSKEVYDSCIHFNVKSEIHLPEDLSPNNKNFIDFFMEILKTY